MSESTKTVKKFKLRVKYNATEAFKNEVLGNGAEVLSQSRLPIKKVILQRWRFLRRNSELNDPQPKSDTDLASQMTREVIEVWSKANIPTQRIDKIKSKILALINIFRDMLKHCERYDIEQEPLKSYCASLENLFDISVQNLHQTLRKMGSETWAEDWEFYQNQCQVPQVGCIGALDKTSLAIKKRKNDREERERERREKYKKQVKTEVGAEMLRKSTISSASLLESRYFT